MSKLSSMAALSFALVLSSCSFLSDADSEQVNTDQPAKAEIPYRDWKQNSLTKNWTSAVNGYLNTHKIEVTDIAKGLQIPWAGSYGREYWGTLTSTGNISQKGNPIFNVIVFDGGATVSSSKRNGVEIKVQP